MFNEPVKTFRPVYENLLVRLLDFACPTEVNARTGQRISVLDPMSFSLDLSSGLLPVPGIRKVFPRTAAAEVAWFIKGDQSVDFIKRYAPIWDKFVEDDGVTIKAAYGYRWRSHFGRDQIGDAIDALVANPSDRRVYISAWDPADDGLGRPGKNVPCPVGFTLSITAGKLNSTIVLRSSDVFVGLPYDVMGHALLMQAILSSINVRLPENTKPLKLGVMQVTLAHPHMYECHWDMAAQALGGIPVDGEMKMPDWGIRRIGTIPEGYVEHVTKVAKEELNQPDFHCRPEIVQ